MKQSSLIVEYLIIGFLILVAVFELYAIIFNLDHVVVLQDLIGYKEIAIIIATIITYIFGAVFHRLSRFLTYYNVARITASIGIKLPARPRLSADEFSYVFQYASSAVIERIGYNESLMRLFRGTNLISPVIGILTWIWFKKMNLAGQGLFILVGCLLLSLASFISHMVLAKEHVRLMHIIWDELKTNKSKQHKENQV